MNKIPEGTREWETFKYDSFHIPSAVFNNPDRPIPISSISSSTDTGLTAFAQLGALRLNASRALISLFDRQHQYVVAEATRSMPLSPNTKYPTQNHLWLCGTAIPRTFGICEHVLVGATQDQETPSTRLQTAPPYESELPVSVVPDLAADRRFCNRPYINAAPYNRFYAGVPIRSPKGINIGVYCIFDDRPRSGLDADSVQFLQDMSRTIMDYLHARRVTESYRRSERMVQGLGNFIEGRDDPVPTAGPTPRPSPNGFDPTGVTVSRPETDPPSPTSSEAAAPVRPSINPIIPEPMESPTKVDSSDSMETTATTATVATTTSSTAPPDPHLSATVKIFSRAANVIRKALEVDGALFLDASIGSFGGLVTGPRRPSEVADRNFSSSEDSLSERSEDANDRWCKSFGGSSIMDDVANRSNVPQVGRVTLRERFLRRLLKRYPNGKVFSFDETGNWLAADYESDDADVTPTEETEQPLTRPENKAAHSYFTKRNEARTIIDVFPGARSVAVVPLSDPSKERCFAGGFVWSKSATRILTPAADLPFIRAFGMVTMSEVIRLDAILADRAKTDILGSLSHELRSPLHGVVAAAELLHDTQLDAFQVDVIHTIEISGKTLLDTIDHLLDYSKVNTFLRASKSQRRNNGPGRGLRPEQSASIESGMMTLVSDVHLDLLVEEVIESVFIGYSFHHMVASSLARHGSSGPPTPAQEKLDAIATSDGLGHRRSSSESPPTSLKDVKILVDIDPESSWVFHTNPGAIRRIVMNLFGNALKYTSKGFIKVQLRQDEVVHKSSRSASMVVLTVTDSGKGISEEFLHTKLFTPFSQEDALAPGTGLGLSLVRQIVTGLGGTISVRSQVGHGTSIKVSMPLVLSRKASSRGRKFSADLQTLAGTKLSVQGFSRGFDESEELRAGGLDLPVESLPFKWMDVKINQDSQDSAVADLVVCSEEAFKGLGLSETGGVEKPLVVVCGNAEAAQKLATSYRRSLRHEAVMEFIAQPTGPRKVAKALACALDRWKQRQLVKSAVVSPLSDAFPAPAPSPRALKSEALAMRPRAQSETVKMVRVASPPPDMVSQSPGDSWIANTTDSNNFTLTLPFRPAASAVAPSMSTASARGTIGSGASPSPAAIKPPSEFLLVDDNAINLKILSAYMKRLHKRSATASNGIEALQAYTSHPERFCCILIDITMPVMDGLEATRRIREFERARNLPPVIVIAITSLGSVGARQEGFASGMDLFLTRPVTMTELVKILKQRKLVDDTVEKEVLPK
ncbi:sensor histidine kinase response regulator (hsp90-like protein) [Colletotrichum tabaci]|uniref:histidine kinase n=1 Tax=Colletotrichum tabaci TaxID=1209068 RepID=A0AAV9TGI8_9PEZI